MASSHIKHIESYPAVVSHMYRKLDGEQEPYVAVRNLIDCFDCFVKFLAICGIQQMAGDPEGKEYIRETITKKIIKPSLGVWNEYIGTIVNAPDRFKKNDFLQNLSDYYGIKGKRGFAVKRGTVVFKRIDSRYDFSFVKPAFNSFVSIRNWYAHGIVPDSNDCQDHFDKLFPILSSLLDQAVFLSDYQVRPVGSKNMPCLMTSTNEKICFLYPLTVFSGDEMLFFRDAQLFRKRKLTYQNYLSAASILETEPFQAFNKLCSLDKIDASYLYHVSSRYSDEVIGRENDLNQVYFSLLSGKSRILVTGHPGIGKTAFSMYIREIFDEKGLYCCVSTYFTAHDRKTLTLEHLYESLLTQLRGHDLVKREYPADFTTEQVKESLTTLLENASVSAEKRKKEVLIIFDGLDEAVSNSAERCIRALPTDCPPFINIIYLSRPIRFVETWWGQAGESSTKRISLNPLAIDAVRAFLEQAIPWPVLKNDTQLIQRAASASEGHPLYLKHLVESILEGREDRRLKTLPKGMASRYNEIFDRAIREKSSLAILSLLAVSSEPLSLEDLHEIMEKNDRLSPESVRFHLDAFMEVLKIADNGKGKSGYTLFHFSTTEYIKANFPDAEESAKTKLLAWQFPDVADFTGLLEKIRQGTAGAVLYLSMVQCMARRKPSRDLLVDMFSTFMPNHPGLYHILKMSYREKEPVYKGFVIDVLKQTVAHDPPVFIEKISLLIKEFPDDMDLYSVILHAVMKKDLGTGNEDELLRLISARLFMDQRRTAYLQMIHLVAGLAGTTRGFDLFLRIMWNLLPFNDIRGSGEIFLVTRLLNDVGLSPSVIALCRDLIHREKKLGLFKGCEKPLSAVLKAMIVLSLSPKCWGNTLSAGARTAPIALKSLFHIRRAVTCSSICADLMLQAVPLIFTLRDRPYLTAEGVGKIIQIELFIRRLSRRLAIRGSQDIVTTVQQEFETRHYSIAPVFMYLGAIVFLSGHLRDMFNYSRPGIEALSSYTKKNIDRIKTHLTLLDPDTPLRKDDQDQLTAMLLEKDAFNNYFAMITIILHAQNDLDAGIDVISRMMKTLHSPTSGTERNPAETLKIYRQAISIFSYIFRRLNQEDQIRKASVFSLQLLDSLKTELKNDSSLQKAFTRLTIYNQGDPFFPLLPLGICFSGKTATTSMEKQFQKLFHQWIDFAEQCDDPDLMFKRVLLELVSLSYFNADFAMELAIEIFRTSDNDMRKHTTIEVIGFINNISPGCLERVYARIANFTHFQSSEMMTELYGAQPPKKELQLLLKAMRVFAWHECITTVMLYHRKISSVVIHGFDESFKNGITLNPLICDILIKLAEFFFSKEISGDFHKAFEVDCETTE